MSTQAVFFFCLIASSTAAPTSSPTATTSSPTTPLPTIYHPPDNKCDSPQYTDHNDWDIETETASFLDEDTNLFWIKLYEPTNSSTQWQRWLFNISTDYTFAAQYDHVLFTTDIYGNFSQDPNYYIDKINPKFFISDIANYIGISFDTTSVRFTATSCDGSSSIPSGPIPTNTTSISYIHGTNLAQTAFGGSHIQIAVESNQSASSTLISAQWTDDTGTIYQSNCEYNSIFTSTSNLVLRAASAENDDYYRLNGVQFEFCSTEWNDTVLVAVGYCEQPQFVSSINSYTITGLSSTNDHENITYNGITEQFHGLYHSASSSDISRTITNPTPSELVTISFKFLSVYTSGMGLRRFEFLYGTTNNMTKLNTFQFNTSYCPMKIANSNISIDSDTAKTDEIVGNANSLVCMEKYSVNITSSLQDIIIKFQNTVVSQNPSLYFAFNDVCITEPGYNAVRVNASDVVTEAPTPAPTDFIYDGCPMYQSKLSDYTQLNGTDIDRFRADSQHIYTYDFKAVKESEWLLSANTYIVMDTVSQSSMTVELHIADDGACKDPMITIKDITQFISVRFTSESVGFYPECDTVLGTVPINGSIYGTYPYPVKNLTYDTNYIIWEQGFDITVDPKVVLIKDINTSTITAYVERVLNTASIVDYTCTWYGTFSATDTLDVLIAASTSQSCRITSIEVSYCDTEWDYSLDFCEDISDAALWSNNQTTSMAQKLVHGTFPDTQPPLHVVYDNVPHHELVDINTILYISGKPLTSADIIDFQITLDGVTKVLASYTGQTENDCNPPWMNVTDTYCALFVDYKDFNHTVDMLNISISINIQSRSQNTTSFNWAFSELCLNQSFRITEPPTPSPTRPPTLPTLDPTAAPTLAPTESPSSAPTHPTSSPTFSPSQSPTTSPSTAPTGPPTAAPSGSPTLPPSGSPSQPPTKAPSGSPSQPPSGSPSQPPTQAPSKSPTQLPSNAPSFSPSTAPSGSPSQPPTNVPSLSPSTAPSGSPSQPPTNVPSFSPSRFPSGSPSQPPSNAPSTAPSDPTTQPTQDPTSDPTVDPTLDPTMDPTLDPTHDPTYEPTNDPTNDPTVDPTLDPTMDPSLDPTHDPTYEPTNDPTYDPTIDPTRDPTYDPTVDPTRDPTYDPTIDPTGDPTIDPTHDPTIDPTRDPTYDPTIDPTRDPTVDPTSEPTLEPTRDPTTEPTMYPTDAPSISPTTAPSHAPTAINETKAQLKWKNNTHGFCTFNCWECLQQIDIINGNNVWAMTFRGNSNNCECPKADSLTSEETDTMIAIDIQLTNPQYSLIVEKYPIDDDSDSDDQGNEDTDDDQDTDDITYGIRVRVLYWIDDDSNCTISYIVNENAFLGVLANNVLIITFTICDLPDEELTDNAVAQSEQDFAERFSNMFNVSLDQVTCSIKVGLFCDKKHTRRRLLQTGSDEEVTVVIIFASAADATAAEENACADLVDVEEEDCEVAATTEDALVVSVTESAEIFLGLTTAGLVGVIVGMVALIILVCVVCFLYELYKTRKQDMVLASKYNKQRKHTGDEMRGVITRPNLKHQYISSEDHGIQMSQREGATTTTTTATVTHGHFNQQSMEVLLPSTDIPIKTSSQETTGTTYMKAYRMETGDDGSAYVVNNYDDVDYLHENEDAIHFGVEYKSEQEMIEEVINSGKANEIKQDELEMDQQIGSGQFGAVFKATWEGNVVVVKQLNSDGNAAETKNDEGYDDDDVEYKQMEDEQTEKAKLARAKEMKAEIILASSIPAHKNLVEIFGYIRSPFGVVMSYMPGDSVQKYVYRMYKKKSDPIPHILELLIILRKAAAGLKFLHQYGLVHRDIACRNILLGKINKGAGIVPSTEVRISDFGLTRELADKRDKDATQKTQSTFGPLKWMAPESIKAKEYSKKTDVYMFGITMWEVFYGMEPYIDMTAVNVAIKVVTKGGRPKIIDDPDRFRHTEMPDGYQHVMQNCWHQKPNKRPTFSQILKLLGKVESNPVRRAP